MLTGRLIRRSQRAWPSSLGYGPRRKLKPGEGGSKSWTGVVWNFVFISLRFFSRRALDVCIYNFLRVYVQQPRIMLPRDEGHVMLELQMPAIADLCYRRDRRANAKAGGCLVL